MNIPLFVISCVILCVASAYSAATHFERTMEQQASRAHHDMRAAWRLNILGGVRIVLVTGALLGTIVLCLFLYLS